MGDKVTLSYAKMLNPHQAQAVKIHNRVFSFLGQFPLAWNGDFSRLAFQPKLSALIGYGISILNTCILNLACVYDLVSSYILNRSNYNIGIASLHVICLIILTLMLLIVLAIVRHPECVSALNLLILEHMTERCRGTSYKT